nr:probable membrane-associated kinase regulator 4 [Ipomoea batatas]
MQRPLLCAGLLSNRMPRNRKYHHHHLPLPYSINAADDEYIDIEVSNSFSPESRSFEFQMCSVFGDEEEDPTAIFPADDLFYQGKLLPLSLQTLPSVEEDDFIIMDFASSTNSPPFKPCRLSSELSNNGFTTLISNKHPPGKFWSEKLRLIKKCLITKKLKASRAYLRSLFRKPPCSIEATSSSADYKSPPGTEKQAPNGKKTPLFPSMGRWRHPIIAGVIKKINKGRIIEDHNKVNHRSSSDFYELNFHNRSFSFASCSDFEGSIEAAISHCKQSQELPNPRKSFIESGHYHYLLPRLQPDN